MARKAAPGIRLLKRLRGGTGLSYGQYKVLVLVLTYLVYASYHVSRKPASIVKDALHPSIHNATQPAIPTAYLPDKVSKDSGWAPFNGAKGQSLLGMLDVAFLITYSGGLFVSGHLGDRVNVRLFLTWGMLLSGLFTALFGAGYFLQIHNFWYYIAVQVMAGLSQSTGWPSVVSIVANWVGKSKRGLIMGIWNSHTSVGNILGSVIAAEVLPFGWGWSFVVPAGVIAGIGVLTYLFLVVEPEEVGLPSPYIVRRLAHSISQAAHASHPSHSTGLDSDESDTEEEHYISFIAAWRIPGVAVYAFSLFFAKLVAYTFLYWLPYYIHNTHIGHKYLSPVAAGNLSALFDVGGVVGGVAAGYISDRFQARSITAASFVFLSVPALFLYSTFGHISVAINAALMILAGLFVNGPYALITTAVAADLGTHSSLQGKEKALATVTAIIDGTGSIGAALGPLLTGFLAQYGWAAVFYMLYTSALISGLLLSRLVAEEVHGKLQSYRGWSMVGLADMVPNDEEAPLVMKFSQLQSALHNDFDARPAAS
eukprot:jgi/Chlat1/8385/Chrsp80S07821